MIMKITPEAIEALSQALSNAGKTGAGIRIFAQEGCCGPSLQMSLVEEMPPDHQRVNIENVDFFVEDKAQPLLTGVTIDFADGGFRLLGLEYQGGCC